MKTAVSAAQVAAFTPVASANAWRETLALLPDAHALQSWTWGQFKSRWGWSATAMRLSIPREENGTKAAALLLKRSLPWLPFSMIYVPRGPVLDYADGALRRIVLAELEWLARKERAMFVKIDPEVVQSWGISPERPSVIGSKFMRDLRQRNWRYSPEQIQFRNTMELSLRQTEEELLAGMKQKTRYNIRLAGRKGIMIRHGDQHDFPMIAGIYQQTAQRDGFAVRSVDYYLDIWRSFYLDGMAQPLIAEYQGEAIAAVVVIMSGDRAIYMYGASTNKERNRMPNHLLQWEAIRWAKSQGAMVYDFWGAPDEFAENDRLWGVWRFKAGFQGEVVRHIGAWDFPVKPIWYRLYNNAMPRLRQAVRLATRNTGSAARGAA